MENEIDIKRILQVLWKQIWIIIVLGIIFSVFGAIYSVFFTKPLYESSSRMIVSAEPALMNTLMVMIKEPSFLEQVVDELDLNKTPESLSTQVSAGSIGGSSIVKISVIDTNPELAAKIANTTTNIFIREMPNLLEFSGISKFSEAKINPYPINQNHEKKILLGFLVGMIAGIGLIFLLDFLDDTIRSERSTEQLLDIPILGSVSKMNKKNTSFNKNEKLKVEVRGETIGDVE